jgi:hypothetical protein
MNSRRLMQPPKQAAQILLKPIHESGLTENQSVSVPGHSRHFDR